MQCAWIYDTTPEMKAYHDDEWGKEKHDDCQLFEFLALEILQAGLSWQIVLAKRPALRTAFANFDVQKVAQMDEMQIQELLNNPNIIRNRRKIEAIINNAKLVVKLKRQGHSLDELVWNYVDYQPLNNHWKYPEEIPNQTKLSSQIAKDFKKLGFSFLGPTIVYSFLQAVGVVNDHLEGCSCK
ncbi:DNA-3-methyladenine glycosylase I [Ligilactobacillus sp. Marseille-Q7487]|uniref:DNA-3-methyladenine glycosylase I n=1 Tax=Ligilactobacillus sp. Marseille-Q7487 TaxID=3022128 RepID=UPI0024A8DD9C|nr:DNA-3-methyladenine glycosylase I [Ligilactobacillus sp. Marseille-Q7487]